MEDQISNLHYIPKDALIPIEIGAGFLFRLQKALIFLVIDKTPEELDELKEHMEKGTIPEDTWMEHYATIQTLIAVIESTAINKKLTMLKSE